jgi:hypothetical protein
MKARLSTQIDSESANRSISILLAQFRPDFDWDVERLSLVMVTGTDIPGGYMGKGTTGMDRDTYFGTRYHTHTHTRHTRTHSGGFGNRCFR